MELHGLLCQVAHLQRQKAPLTPSSIWGQFQQLKDSVAAGDKTRGIHMRAQQEQIEQLQGQLVQLCEENKDLQRRIDDLNAIRRQLREQLEEARHRQREFLTDRMGKEGQKASVAKKRKKN